MSKILFIATVVKTHILVFHIPYLKMFKELGWETAVAARNDYKNPDECIIPYCDTYYDIPFERNPFTMGNIKAYKKLKKVINNGQYDIIHCHTPVGAMLSRLAANNIRKLGCKVFYTAHGFHFYRSAPIKNWLLYYPVEWLCSFWTDTLITINQEDYNLARKHMHAKKIEYVPGVGVDIHKFGQTNIDRTKKRKELGVPAECKLLLSVGELNKNKNQALVIRALSQLDRSDVYYVIAGCGDKESQLKKLAKKLGLADRIKLLGFRKDVSELCAISDAFIFPSFREGLSVALMEAMASMLPCAVSNIRGNVDLIDEQGGYKFNPHSVDECKATIEKLLELDKENLAAMGQNNACNVKKFSMEVVLDKMKKIYY